jgi:hypothetical protein
VSKIDSKHSLCDNIRPIVLQLYQAEVQWNFLFSYCITFIGHNSKYRCYKIWRHRTLVQPPRGTFSRILRSKLYQEMVCCITVDEVHMIEEW